MMTATGLPRSPWSSTWRSSVVFPLPRKPVRMSTATVCMLGVRGSSSEVRPGPQCRMVRRASAQNTNGTSRLVRAAQRACSGYVACQGRVLEHAHGPPGHQAPAAASQRTHREPSVSGAPTAMQACPRYMGWRSAGTARWSPASRRAAESRAARGSRPVRFRPGGTDAIPAAKSAKPTRRPRAAPPRNAASRGVPRRIP